MNNEPGKRTVFMVVNVVAHIWCFFLSIKMAANSFMNSIQKQFECGKRDFE